MTLNQDRDKVADSPRFEGENGPDRQYQITIYCYGYAQTLVSPSTVIRSRAKEVGYERITNKYRRERRRW